MYLRHGWYRKFFEEVEGKPESIQVWKRQGICAMINALHGGRKNRFFVDSRIAVHVPQQTYIEEGEPYALYHDSGWQTSQP